DIHDASGIQKSIDLTGRAYYGNAFETGQNHKMYKHLKKLNDIRKAIPALQSGSWAWSGNSPGNGVSFVRTLGDQRVVVGLAKDGDASFSFSGLPNGIYRDAVTGREITVSGGNLSFSVKSNSAGIYVLNGPGMIGESGVGYFEACVTGCTTTPKLTISPIGDNYTEAVTVNMQANGGTGAITIRYTTDGSEPTTSSAIYSGPFNVSVATTIKAIAFDANNKKSDLEAQRYTFVLPKPKVSITPAAGNYFNPIAVTLKAENGKAPFSIYYTTNGNTPTTASSSYGSPINISNPTTIKAIAVDANNQVSYVKTANYTFDIPNPVITANPSGGNYPDGSVQVVLEANSPRLPVTIRYTTDGTNPTVTSAVYNNNITLNGPQAKILKFIGTDNEGRTS
ncbi:MAG: chitobiase/beta-hexosaminidase C-terminal domain-containing protein, partial [Chitinophagaceae bacterium]